MPRTLLYATPLLLLLIGVVLFLNKKKKPKVLLKAVQHSDICIRVEVDGIMKHDFLQVLACLVRTYLDHVPAELKEAALDELFRDLRESQQHIETRNRPIRED